LALRLLERLELFLYRSAARVVVVTHSFRTSLGSRGVDVSKIDVVTNGVDLSQFVPAEKPQDLVQLHGLEGRFVAGYIGTHGLAHGLNTLLDAAKLLQDMPEAQNVHLLFLGHGAEKAGLIQRSQELGLRNVLFLDSVPKQEVVRYWSLLDVSVIHLRKAELFGSVIPSKLFECMGMGLPVLHGVMGESAEIVRREAVGCVFESENAMELAQGLLRMRKDADAYAMYRANALRAAKRYDRKYLARCMLDVLHKFKGT
jgi:glycosyltransferase involved in cell wall biosynthesis